MKAVKKEIKLDSVTKRKIYEKIKNVKRNGYGEVNIRIRHGSIYLIESKFQDKLN